MYDVAALRQMAFPMLTTVKGDFLFARNPSVGDIAGFPKLATIGGSLDLTGNFGNVEMPLLVSVGGGVNVQTTSSSFQCPANLRSLGTSGVCEGGVRDPAPKGSTTSSTGSTSLPTNGLYLFF